MNKKNEQKITETTARLPDLRVNGVAETLAVDDAHPTFSWRMECGRTGARQTAYRINVTSGGAVCWDSGKVASDASLGIAYPEDAVPLTPETDYRVSLSVWDETGAELTAARTFSTGFLDGSLAAWHGAKWIGPDEIAVAAETVPVFRLRFGMRIKQGGSAAGVVFGANDPRLSSPAKNNFLIGGENYIAYRLNVRRVPAAVEVYRRGYAPGEAEETLLEALKVPESVLSAENRYAEHRFEIAISGNQMEYMTVDGVKLETAPENAELVRTVFHPDVEPTHLVLNPLRAVIDVPIFPRLSEVGFTTADGTEAVFTDFSVCHYGGEQAEIFGQNTGATYGIFSGKTGLHVSGAEITAAPGTRVTADPSFGGAPMLRRTFSTEAEKPIVSAKLYAAARGIFELRLNGEKIGDEYLEPGDMDFRRRIYYTMHDVTALLRPGENALGATLASGWYGDQVSYTIENYNFYGDRPAFLAVLALTYADGSKSYLPTDGRWQYFGGGPVRYAANFNGETYDATREATVEGWDTARFAALNWRAAAEFSPEVCGATPVLTAKPDPGVTAREALSARYVGQETRGGETVYLYDMGVNMVGVPEITFRGGEAGRRVTVRYAEIRYPRLPADNPYHYGALGGMILTENLRGALATDRYIQKGGETEVFRPVFTFHGYRYVELSGISAPLPEADVKGIVLSSVWQTSFYDSSNPLTNQLFQNIIHSTLGNHLSIPTDCPQRDERLGWAGDANVYAETATYMADVSSFYRNFALLQRDAQGADGTFASFAPSFAPLGTAFALGYTWNAPGVTIPFETWQQYGDRRVLEENYPNMRLHALGMMEKKAAGRQFLTNHIGFLGDHLAVTDTDPALMDNAQFYRSMRRVAQAAALLGKTEDAARFDAYADGLRAEWNAVFVNGEGRTVAADGTLQDTQASYAMPLMCGVFSAENEPRARRHLAEACRRTGCTMTTGFMGTGPLLPALTEGGDAETAYALFEQTACPSWLYPVCNGATSIWERWDSFTVENGFSGHNHMNSFNHYSLGAVGTWMMAYQAGIRRGDAPGFQRFVLQPTPGGSFTHLDAAYESVLGTIRSSWEAEDGILTAYEAVVPANTSATLYLPISRETAEALAAPDGAVYRGMTVHNGAPAAEFALAAGSYRFALR